MDNRGQRGMWWRTSTGHPWAYGSGIWAADGLVRFLASLTLCALILAPEAAAHGDTGSLAAALGAEAMDTSKPFSALDVTLRPRNDRTAPGGEAVADLTVTPTRAAGSFRLSLRTSGGVQVTSSLPRTLPGRSAGASVNAEVRYTTRGGGDGELRISVQALDAAGSVLGTRSATLYTLTTGSDVLHSASGHLDARLRSLELRRDRGTLSPSAFEAESRQTAGGGAKTIVSIRSAPRSAPRAAAAGPLISGQTQWTDSAGGSHPIRLAVVQILQSDGGSGTLLGSTQTDASGQYSISIDPSGDGSARDLFVRVLAQTAGASVRLNAVTIQRIDSAVQAGVPNDAALNVDLNANNSDDNNTAFSVLDAIVTGLAFLQQVNGPLLPDLNIYYPSTSGTGYSTNRVTLLRGDRFDWDVIQHELGHHVQRQLDITAGVGGPHGLSENLGETLGKSNGIRLAWSEGWPTYFSIQAQISQDAASYDIPNVGDTGYQDTDDTDIDIDLETQNGGPSLGEDNEVSVQRILWDLADAANDTGDAVSLGAPSLFVIVDQSDAQTLSAAYQAVIAGRGRAETARIGCIMGEHRVAPQPISPANGSTVPGSTRPTFSWSANGGGPSNRNNSFTVQFYDVSFDNVILTSSTVTGTSFTPTQSQWSTIVGAANGQANWVVIGRQTRLPATGPYTSCGSSLAIEGSSGPGPVPSCSTPVASINRPKPGPQKKRKVRFSAKYSLAKPCKRAVVLWEFGDGQTGSKKSLSHTYATAGDYTVRLTVEDESGSKTTVSVSITVP
ncbi:MAG: PKD domain-containing protein [Chloroflexi bacterium]|nr:PKD domain-containing protein [Chloroflexota bacterium]